MSRKIWLLLTIFSLFTFPFLNAQLTTTLRVPQSGSQAGQAVLQQEFGEDIEGTFTIIYHYKKASLDQINGYKEATRKAASIIPGAEVVLTRAAVGYFFAIVQTPLSLPEAAAYTADLRAAIKNVGLRSALIGGPPAIKSDVTPILNQDLLRGELIGLFVAAVILIALLGFTRVLLIPLLFTLAVTSLSLGLLFLVSLIHPMALYLPNIISLLSLGLSLDYSLLVIYRYRSERKRGASHEQALATTRSTAIRTVSFSAALIAGCLSLLFLINVPFIRSITLGVLFVPVIAAVAALTYLPALLEKFGEGDLLNEGRVAQLQRRFASALSTRAIAHPVIFLLVSLLLLSLFSLGAGNFSPTPSSITSLPSTIESQKAIATFSSRLGDGVITPHIIIINGPPSQSYTKVENAFARLDEVIATSSTQKGDFFKLYLVTKNRLGSAEDQRLVERIRNLNLEKFGITGATLYLAGAPAQGVDLLHAIGSKVAIIAMLALLLLLLSLTRLFGSIVLALKAVIMGALSLSAVLGVMVLLTRYGIGTYRLDQLEAWSVLLTLTILFGLSIDYEIFIVSRIKESHDDGSDNFAAIKDGLHATSVVVTAAALILIGALSGFLFGHFAGVQQLGLGLLVGIAIDVTIVRLFLLPAAMVLLGKWNWWRLKKS